MPYKFSRISKKKRFQLIRCFASDISATQASKIIGLNRNTVNDWFQTFRERIAEHQEKTLGYMSGEIEMDESYFGGMRKKTHARDRRKRGRGAENKVPVFGIKKREDGTVYTQIIKNASKQELLPHCEAVSQQT